jgi:hypothetical protein
MHGERPRTHTDDAWRCAEIPADKKRNENLGDCPFPKDSQQTYQGILSNRQYTCGRPVWRPAISLRTTLLSFVVEINQANLVKPFTLPPHPQLTEPLIQHLLLLRLQQILQILQSLHLLSYQFLPMLILLQYLHLLLLLLQ